MAAGSTYTPIITYTLPSNAAYYDFTSIPTTYTDLVVIVNAGTASTSDITFNVGNGTVDTGNNYSTTWIYGTGSAAGSARNSSVAIGYFDYYGGGTSTLGANISIIHFMNYASTVMYKTILGRAGNAGGGVDAFANMWRSSAAINTLRVKGQTGNLLAGSTISIYGIASA